MLNIKLVRPWCYQVVGSSFRNQPKRLSSREDGNQPEPGTEFGVYQGIRITRWHPDC